MDEFQSVCGKSMKLSIVLAVFCLLIHQNYFLKGAVFAKNGENMRSKLSVFDLIPVDRGEGVDMGHVMQRRTLSMRSGTGRRRVEGRTEWKRRREIKINGDS